ncbi:class I SAM-dependent methyltransferase [Candidatus Dojkabacteria bacterium]|nr:class I SAM-dependent methyltransferase [Candidatus Dojkabacteria bacterium]
MNYWHLLVNIIRLGLAVSLIFLSIRIIFIQLTFQKTLKNKSLVPYLPSRDIFMKKALTLLKLKPSDMFVDIGSGTGKVLFFASRKYGVNSTGIEIRKILYLFSVFYRFFSFNKRKILILNEDYRNVDLLKFNKIYIFGIPSRMPELVKKFEADLKKGTYIASIIFPIKSSELKLKTKTSVLKRFVYLYKKV